MATPELQLPSYQHLDEAGKLIIEWEGPALDLYSMALLHFHTHEIIERVTHWIIYEAALIYPEPTRPRAWRGAPRGRLSPQVIRAVPEYIRVGSLIEAISFMIMNVLEDPDMRAVLENLTANIVWAIGAARVRGITGEPRAVAPVFAPRHQGRPDPVDVGPILRGMIASLAESIPYEGRATIRFRSVERGHEQDVQIVIDKRPR